MPRTKLGSPTPAQQRAVFNRIMRMAMAANDIPDLTALAPRLNMTRQALSYRVNHGGWKYEEICLLVRVLKITGEQLAAMFGIVTAGKAA
ncbi:MAG: hypothetical protein IJE22_08680 [Oscillibacter sp.]|nr:hypothetical protein [Oscillibacter sp.]